jgi:hypothetical protein
VLIAAAVAYALPFRQPNCNTSSHYALVQTIASGTRTIDNIHGETCDVSWSQGHYFANKAPGLALATTPWYAALHALGILRADPLSGSSYPTAMRALPRRDLWLMGLWGAVLPALGLLWLVRSVAERFAPGAGVATAATLAFATLLLPFSSLFFSHVLAAFLTFAAFALLLNDQEARWKGVALAGLLAGFAAVVEYPAGLLVLALGAYAATRHPRLRRGAVFAVGALVGLAPLAAYDMWAFGSPFHLSYVGAVLVPGVSGHDVLGANSVGFFGVASPHLAAALQVLFGSRGLLTLGPVLALAPAGCILLWKRSRPREAAFIGGVCLTYLIYNAAYYSPLGGATPGPRFLILVIPFAALALAPVVRACPLSLLALALPSFALLLAAHLTQPLISPPYEPKDWWHWLRSNGLSSTVLEPGNHGWFPALAIVLAALTAVAAAIGSVRQTDRTDVSAALVCLVAWSTALVSFPHLARSPLGATAIAAMLAIAVLVSRRGVWGVGTIIAVGLGLDGVHRHAALSAALGLSGLALAIVVAKLYVSTPPGRVREVDR